MDARARTPIDLFDSKLTYEIPTFQRPYVWNEDEQWQPLWEDVARAADAVLDAEYDEAVARIAPHLLGAIVIKHLAVNAGDIQRYWVIDGHQRLTTLQVLLDAAALVVGKRGTEADAERLGDLVLNAGARFRDKPERFKALPSRVDRRAFETAMDDGLAPDDVTAHARIVLAHSFFQRVIGDWAGESQETAAHEEVPAEQISSRFQRHARQHLVDVPKAEAFLAELRRDADTFREFAQMSPDRARGSFYSVVIESLELGATTPLLLWLISGNHQVPAEQIDRALAAMESWVLRRMLLKAHDAERDADHRGAAVPPRRGRYRSGRRRDRRVPRYPDLACAVLARRPRDSRRGPAMRAYGIFNQGRLRLVLAAVEQYRRSARNENVSLLDGLQVEHVMPRRWDKFWGEDLAGDPERAARRDRLVDTIGNLTLVTQRLNGTLSNRPWIDEDGKPGKRDLLGQFSLLVLNKDIIGNDAWTEADIAARGQALAETVVAMWPRPALVRAG